MFVTIEIAAQYYSNYYLAVFRVQTKSFFLLLFTIWSNAVKMLGLVSTICIVYVSDGAVCSSARLRRLFNKGLLELSNALMCI